MAEGQAVDSNPATAEAPVIGQADAATSGTVETQNGQANAGQSASVEDQFSSIDPKTLPPELQAVYKNLQSDYTKKTQSIADTRKKAEQYDQISKDSRFVDYWNGLNRQQKADFKEQKVEAEKKLGEKIDDARFQKAFETKDGFLELMAEVAREASAKDRSEIEALKQYKTVNEAQSIVDAFKSEKAPDGKPLRGDFDSLEEDGLINGFLRLAAPDKGYTAEEYPAKLNEAYTWAKTLSAKYYEKGRQEALARIQQKAATSTNPPTKAVKGTYSGSDPKKLTAAEALQMAKRGERIPQVYD